MHLLFRKAVLNVFFTHVVGVCDHGTVLSKIGQAMLLAMEQADHRDRVAPPATAGEIVEQASRTKAPITGPNYGKLEGLQSADASAVVVVREVDCRSDL